MDGADSQIIGDENDWCFDEIAASDAARAAALETAGTPNELVAALCDALEGGLERQHVRLGFEQAGQCIHDHRAVLQFAVGGRVFDWFFNARGGYRAHFRASSTRGLAFNDRLIDSLAGILAIRLTDPVECTELSARFEDLGRVSVPRSRILASLATLGSLPKIWFCTQRIQRDGGIEQLTSGVVGPKILLGSYDKWAAPVRDDGEAWLDIKGAF